MDSLKDMKNWNRDNAKSKLEGKRYYKKAAQGRNGLRKMAPSFIYVTWIHAVTALQVPEAEKRELLLW